MQEPCSMELIKELKAGLVHMASYKVRYHDTDEELIKHFVFLDGEVVSEMPDNLAKLFTRFLESQEN